MLPGHPPLPTSVAEMPRISLRSRAEGGAIRRAPRVTPADLLLRDDEVLLLIHGYASSEPTAFSSYRRFLANVGTPWIARSAGVFWPGDGRSRYGDAPRSWFSVLATASYPWQPQRAREAARYRADLLGRACEDRQAVSARRGRAATPLMVSLVAHSMGCRLALELLDKLRASVLGGQRLRMRSVSLMAAAVPGYHVQERGDLELALATPERTTIYWSRSDRILRFAFPLGQTLERPFPNGWRSRGAMGREGVAGGSRTRTVQVDLGHSDYWPSVAVADDIRSSLEPNGDAARRRPAGRKLPGVRRAYGRRDASEQ